mmetsp:Transcript_3852/g.10378  ORF Transcript_3852/g.10378 Transcript_3852/m.10378 type:complete len:253 (+) Transcript_3852:841-1599(+)
MSSSSGFRPSMICARTRSAATMTSSSGCCSVSKIGSQSRSSVDRRSICAGLWTSSMQIHCRQAVLTTMLSLTWMEFSNWSTSWSTGIELSRLETMSSRPLFISLAMRAISSSRSSMQLRVPPSRSGSIATHFSLKFSLTCDDCCICRVTNSCSQHSAVSLEQASLAKQHLTTMPVVSEMICRALLGGLDTTPFRSSFRHASALCRMSRMWSPNKLKSPSRYCGRYTTMSTSGFLSSRVIQASTSCRMKGFLN